MATEDGKNPKFQGYNKESKWAKKFINRKWRRQGKKKMENADPQKGTQGWFTY